MTEFKKINDYNHIFVHGWMRTKLDLKGIDILVYATIYGYSQDGESLFYGSRAYLSEFTGVSLPTIDQSLKRLVESGLVEKIVETVNNVTFNRYKAILGVVKNFEGGSKDFLGGSKETLPPIENILLNNQPTTNKESKTNGNIIKDIVEFLNSVCGTSYRATTAHTQSIINQRLREGFSLDDFKAVILHKFSEWGNSAKMKPYLRPDTLFGTKFESYVQAAKLAHPTAPSGFDDIGTQV